MATTAMTKKAAAAKAMAMLLATASQDSAGAPEMLPATPLAVAPLLPPLLLVLLLVLVKAQEMSVLPARCACRPAAAVLTA